MNKLILLLGFIFLSCSNNMDKTPTTARADIFYVDYIKSDGNNCLFNSETPWWLEGANIWLDASGNMASTYLLLFENDEPTVLDAKIYLDNRLISTADFLINESSSVIVLGISWGITLEEFYQENELYELKITASKTTQEQPYIGSCLSNENNSIGVCGSGASTEISPQPGPYCTECDIYTYLSGLSNLIEQDCTINS